MLYTIPVNSIVIVATVTIFELFVGATDEYKWQHIKKLTEDLKLIAFSKSIAVRAAKIYQQLKSVNQIIEFRDIFIAATAIDADLPLLTLNKKHFERIEGLIVL